MKRKQRWLFCGLAALVLLTAFSSLVAGSERPDEHRTRPASASPARWIA